MKNIVLETIKKNKMIESGDTIVVGVSGGADSTALLHFLNAYKIILGIEIVVVHINHGVRGIDADADAEFVLKMSEEMKIKAYVFNYNVKEEAKKAGVSEEEAGRIIRYNEFNKIASQYPNSKIAVAHNLNDQAETLLMRICRGAGMKGLAGISPLRDNIIRPLIECKREVIEKYCYENNLNFRTDYTNGLDIYTRNKIRNKLIPWIENEINSNAVANIAKTSSLLATEDEFLDEQAKEIYKSSLIKKDANSIYLDLEMVKKVHLVLARRIIRFGFRQLNPDIKDLTYTHINDIISLLYKGTGKSIDVARGFKASIEYRFLKLYKDIDSNNTGFCYNINEEETIFIKEINKFVKLSVNGEKNTINALNICTKVFDYDKIKFDIKIRTRLPSDRIYFKGLDGYKKIKDYFIDKKIPQNQRDLIPLICCGNDVLWIYQHRASDFYLANDKTVKKIFIQVWEEA